MLTMRMWLVVLGACLGLGGQAWGLDQLGDSVLARATGGQAAVTLCAGPCNCELHEPGPCYKDRDKGIYCPYCSSNNVGKCPGGPWDPDTGGPQDICACGAMRKYHEGQGYPQECNHTSIWIHAKGAYLSGIRWVEEKDEAGNVIRAYQEACGNDQNCIRCCERRFTYMETPPEEDPEELDLPGWDNYYLTKTEHYRAYGCDCGEHECGAGG